jgi:ribonuclease HI
MIELFFDGACEPINPGGTASYGWLLKQDKKILKQGFGVVGKGHGMTNNIAEYNGLIKGLEEFIKLNIKEKLYIKGDSNMVINMISGKWGWNKKKTKWEPHKKMPHLKELLDEALKLLDKIDHEIKWVPREQNEEADLLSKKLGQNHNAAL